jgi:heme oxygenase (biliverdin-producing, ferredoxin)
MLERVDRTIQLPGASSLLEALRECTRQLHVQAERSGIIAEILHGRATLDDYERLLRNLLPVYRTMEAELERHNKSPVVGALVYPELNRATAIAADLQVLGSGRDEPPLPQAITYTNAILDASEGGGARLIAHAYARYLGDLSGGQILKRLLMKSPGVPASALSFYDFPAIGDHTAFKAEYRAAIELAGVAADDFDAVVEEGARAFELNISLSLAVLAAKVRPSS